ncbi:unnamed protein product [Callosobruchus maculatus]|uniref:Uncharacterized protein n=1 Tax=Callosobruchus maculatus TaxID=64391 RepID=A0A653DRY4_CALMS|nr:unnamed protein product [Callosobruchus maculatus]
MSQRVQKIMENAKLIYSSTETAGNGPENLDMPIDLQRSNSYDFDNGQAAAPRNGSNCSVSTNTWRILMILLVTGIMLLIQKTTADHEFYTNLAVDETIQDDIDGYNNELDFEPEDNEQESSIDI